MRKLNSTKWIFIVAGVILLAILIYSLPPVKNRLSWRIDFALAYARGMIYPADQLPTPLPPPRVAVTSLPTQLITPTASATPTPGPTPTLTPTPTPLPASIALAAPLWEKQDINNCGPATMAMYLRYYGWEGDQFTVADLLKPQREDRNVNVEELAYYVRTRAGWLNAEYRVGGNLELLKKLLAAGFPVIIEEAFKFEESYWPNDDLWAAHYNLLTGYDDASQTFTGQDSYYGSDQKTSYEKLDEYWQTFNRVYLLVYLPEQEEQIKAILGSDWDVDLNRQQALATAQEETEQDPENNFAWFNLGTNLVYFERYGEAASAYDKAREIGWPQRMLRYQFGPFFAYFHSGRMDDLEALTTYALQRTPNAEEALLWSGWAAYRQGNTNQAIEFFQTAMAENPNYLDGQYAMEFVRQNP
jgi:tetratricopeptide (TPR) repeat protein